jgi:polyisoprenoid-binding protein YceI
MKTRTKWGIGAIAAVVLIPILIATAGVWIYINWIKDDPPPAFSLGDGTASATTTVDTTVPTDPTTASTGAATTTPGTTTTGATTAGTTVASGTGALDGAWAISDGSQVGYRVTEVLFGQDTEGVGRTGEISGSIELTGAQVTAGEFTVQMATLESDESRRDNQFNGRLLSTDEFPTATFALTAPIELGTLPADGEQVTATATGDLTLRGATNSVTFDVQAVLNGDEIQIVGSTDIVFADYEIPQPDTGGITTQNHGLLEFSLILTQGSG